MKAEDTADTVLERLQAAWQMQPDGERQFFGVIARPTMRSTTTFRWANYLAGTGGLLGSVGERNLEDAALRVLAKMGQLRETCLRGSLVTHEGTEPARVGRASKKPQNSAAIAIRRRKSA